MRESILKVLAILGVIESIGCFLIERPQMGYIFALIAIPSILELIYIKIKKWHKTKNK